LYADLQDLSVAYSGYHYNDLSRIIYSRSAPPDQCTEFLLSQSCSNYDGCSGSYEIFATKSTNVTKLPFPSDINPLTPVIR